MICRRCGREQPALASPCPECEPDLLGSTSPIPQPKVQIPQSMDRTDGGSWGGEVEPSKLIRDPVLRAAFVRAYQAWEKAQA